MELQTKRKRRRRGEGEEASGDREKGGELDVLFLSPRSLCCLSERPRSSGGSGGSGWGVMGGGGS